MSDGELSAATVRYLFAPTWAAPAGSGWNMKVPGGKVDGPDTAANLLSVAVWSLRERGLVDVEQIRAVEPERVVTLGGRSFTRATATAIGDSAGLEAALMTRIAGSDGPGRLGRLLSQDDERGLRGFILALDLSSGSPWASVGDYCRQEAESAGTVARQGRLFRKLVVADEAAFEALRPRDAEIAAARKAWGEREPELAQAVIGDCLAAIHWAHQTPSG